MENELIFKFGYPEQGLDDQDKYEIDEKKANSVNKKGKENEEEVNSKSAYNLKLIF
jgi:hypothetical protein